MRRIGLIAIIGLVAAGLFLGSQWLLERWAAVERMKAWQVERAEDTALPELSREYEWERAEVTLEELAGIVREKSGLPVEVDFENVSSDWEKKGLGRKVRVPRGRFTLGAMLKMALMPVRLCAEGRGKAVVITSVASSAEQSRVRTRVYPLPQGVKGLGEGDWSYLLSSNLDSDVAAVPGAVVVVGNAESQRRARLVIETVAGLRDPRPPSVTIFPPNEGHADKRIGALLDQPVDLDVVEMPLRELTLYLAETYGLPLVLSSFKLEEASVSLDTPITKSLKDISLRSALRLILADLELTYDVRDGTVLITTPEGAEENLLIIAHWVREVFEETEEELDFTSLDDVIASCVRPDSWETGGPSFRWIKSGWLLFEQTGEVHEEVASLLAALRQILVADNHTAIVHSPPMTEATQKIHAALDHEIALSLKGTPLKDVVMFMAESLEIPIVLSQRKLEEASVSPDTPVTLHTPWTRAGLGLELLLRDLELEYVVRDEVLRITTPEDAESQFVTRLYDVRSLVGSMGPSPRLRDLFDSIVEPIPWRGVRTGNSPSGFRGILVATQTERAHGQLKRFIDALRRLDAELAKSSGDKAMVIRAEPTAEQARLEKVLEQVVSVEVDSEILEGALEELAAEHKLPLVLDARACREVGDPFHDFKISVAPFAAEMSLGGTLDRLLLPHNLNYVIRENVIWVSDNNHTEALFDTRLYCIDDLATKGGENAYEIGEQAAFAVENARAALIGSSAALIDSIGPNWLIVVAPRSRQEDVADWLTERRTGKTPKRAEERRVLYEKIVSGKL